MSICWMCNESEATTGEHIFKHSVLKDLVRNVSFNKGDRLISRSQKKHNGVLVPTKKIIQSTDSNEFKFLNSLCQPCNNATSKKWDNEFDLFLRYVLLNWKEASRYGYINIKSFHPGCSKRDTRNLYNYFCKIFGCLLSSKNLPVPKNITEVVSGLNYSNSLGVNVVFDVDLKEIEDFGSLLVNHDLTGDYLEGQQMGITENCRWALGFGPIKIAFWYKTPPAFVIGEPWYGKSKRINFSFNT